MKNVCNKFTLKDLQELKNRWYRSRESSSRPPICRLDLYVVIITRSSRHVHLSQILKRTVLAKLLFCLLISVVRAYWLRVVKTLFKTENNRFLKFFFYSLGEKIQLDKSEHLKIVQILPIIHRCKL